MYGAGYWNERDVSYFMTYYVVGKMEKKMRKQCAEKSRGKKVRKDSESRRKGDGRWNRKNNGIKQEKITY